LGKTERNLGKIDHILVSLIRLGKNRYLLHLFFYKNNFIRTQGSFLLKI